MGIIIPPSPHPRPAQPTPLGVFPTYCFPHPVTLALREKVLNLSGDGFSITDTDGRVVAKCKGKFLTMHDRTSQLIVGCGLCDEVVCRANVVCFVLWRGILNRGTRS
jgi:hypothetical protein